MTPPRDGDGDGEMVAQIIPLRRRAGPIAPPRSPDHRPREVLAPPREPPAATERSVWDQPTTELRRRTIPDSVWSTDAPAPSAPLHRGRAERWALMPAAVGVAALALVALVLVVGGLLLARADRGSPHAGASASSGRTPAGATHGSVKPHLTVSHRTGAADTAHHPHRTHDRHTHHATATHPVAKTDPAIGESAPVSISAGAPATVQEVSTPPSTSSGTTAEEPAHNSTSQTTTTASSSPGAPRADATPKARSAGGGYSEFGFEH